MADDHIEYLEGLTLLKIEYEHIVTLHQITLAFSAKLDPLLLSGVPDYFGRIKISSGGDLSHYSSASLY